MENVLGKKSIVLHQHFYENLAICVYIIKKNNLPYGSIISWKHFVSKN